MPTPDLDSADWLCFLTKTMIQDVNTNIPVFINKKTDENEKVTKRLIVAINVSEKDVKTLNFLTNTNTNNNYLYLENFSVYLDENTSPTEIPGLKEALLEMWRYSDSQAFLKGEKTHCPFLNINKFVDDYANLHLCLPKTYLHVKKYNIHINPDFVCADTGGICGVPGSNEGCCHSSESCKDNLCAVN